MTAIEQINQKLKELDTLVILSDHGDLEQWQEIKRRIGELRDFVFDCYLESKTLPKTTPENTHGGKR